MVDFSAKCLKLGLLTLTSRARLGKSPSFTSNFETKGSSNDIEIKINIVNLRGLEILFPLSMAPTDPRHPLQYLKM
jgi:hypothetical protein